MTTLTAPLTKALDRAKGRARDRILVSHVLDGSLKARREAKDELERVREALDLMEGLIDSPEPLPERALWVLLGDMDTLHERLRTLTE